MGSKLIQAADGTQCRIDWSRKAIRLWVLAEKHVYRIDYNPNYCLENLASIVNMCSVDNLVRMINQHGTLHKNTKFPQACECGGFIEHNECCDCGVDTAAMEAAIG